MHKVIHRFEEIQEHTKTPEHTNWLGDHPQPVSAQAVDGMRHVGFGMVLVLYHCLCYKNDVILYDQSNS